MNEKVNQNKSALLYIIAAVVLFSALPITFSIGGASNAPFLFVAVVCLFASISNITYLFFKYPEKINQSNRKIILSHLRRPLIFFGAFGLFGYVLFAFALRYIDEAIAATLMGKMYIFTIPLLARFFPEEGTYYADSIKQKWFLFTVALVGTGFVIASQSSSIDNAVGELFTFSVLGGVGLALAASLLVAIGLYANQEWGFQTRHWKAIYKVVEYDDEIFYPVAANIIGATIIVPVLVVIGLLSGESIQSIGGVGVLSAAAYGFFGLGIGCIFFYIAIPSDDRDHGIDALSYATPAVSLIWLALASLIDVPHIDWLVIGVTAIIAANFLLAIEGGLRSAYKALIIALWVCGMVVYLHDGLPLSGYAERIGVISALFILILVFRANRFVRRTTDEEKSVFLVFHGLKTLAKKRGMDDDAQNQLRYIDNHTKQHELRAAYDTLKQHFITVREQHPEHEEKLEQLEAEIDTLVHSKQQGTNFGELIALGFITFILVSALLLFKPPGLTEWDGLFTEISSFLLTTVIIFLFFNIFDLQLDRTKAILVKRYITVREKSREIYSVDINVAAYWGRERLVLVILFITITLAYIWLFLGKWIF